MNFSQTIQILTLLAMAAASAVGQSTSPEKCPLEPEFLELRERCDRGDGGFASETCAVARILELLAQDHRDAAMELLYREFAYPETSRESVVPWLESLAKALRDADSPPECVLAQAQAVSELGSNAVSAHPEVLVFLGQAFGWSEIVMNTFGEQRLDPATDGASKALGQATRQVLASTDTGKMILNGVKANPLVEMVCGQTPEPTSVPAIGSDDGDEARRQIDVALRLGQVSGLDEARATVSEARSLATDQVHEAKLLARAGIGFLIGEFNEAGLDYLRQADELLSEHPEATPAIQILHALTRYFLAMAYRELGFTALADEAEATAGDFLDGKMGEVMRAIGGSFLGQNLEASAVIAQMSASGELDAARLEPLMEVLGDVVPGLDLDLLNGLGISPGRQPIDSSCFDEVFRLLELLSLRRFDDAAAVAETLIENYPSYNSVYLLTLIAGKQFLEKDHDGAVRNSRKAVDALADKVDTFRVSETLIHSIDHKIYLVFRLAVEMAGQAYRVEAAFNEAERGRAWALRRLLGGSPNGSDSSELSAQERKTLAAIRDLEDVIRTARPEDQRVLDAELATHRQTFGAQRLGRKLEGAEVSPLARVGPVTLHRLRTEVLPPLTTLLVFAEGTDHLWAWVIDRESVEMVPLPISGEERTAEVNHAVRKVSRRGASRLTTPLDESLRALHSRLIGPLTQHLRYENLIIVPHGVLHHLPFAALRNPRTGAYLIEEFTLSFSPSASALEQILQSATVISEDAEALVLGDPATELEALPGAREEAKAVASLLGTEPLLGERATKTAVLRYAETVGLLHLAAHGEYTSSAPIFSWIRLGSDERRHGLVEMHEIWDRWRFPNARLVALSGCETALGELTRGDEVLGLTQAFLVAGSDAVLSTLWSVDDEASKKLIVAFYERLLDGMPAAEALRQAQQELMQEYADPFFWAGYTLTGDPQARWHTERRRFQTALPPALALLMAGVVSLGFFLPPRFPHCFGAVLSPDEDIHDGHFHRIRTARRFFSAARIYISADRLQDRPAGALARVRARRRGVHIQAMPGHSLWQQSTDGEWQPLSGCEHRARVGTVYRDERGTIFFQLRRL